MSEKVQIQVEATSPADAAIASLQAKIKGLETEMRKSARGSKQATDEFTGSIKKGTDGVGGLQAGLAKLGPMIASTFSVAAVMNFVRAVQKANEEIAKAQGAARMTMVQAATGTGDTARLGQLQSFTQAQFQRLPNLSEADIAGAFSSSRGILKRDGEFDRSLAVAQMGLEVGQYMESNQRQQIIEAVAAMESVTPSANRMGLQSRMAQVTQASQTSGVAGFDVLKGLLRSRGLEGIEGAGVMEDLLATAGAAKASGLEARSMQSIIGIPQRLAQMTDEETGERQFTGTQAEIFQRMMRGQITPARLMQLGIDPQTAGMVGNVQGEFAAQRARMDALAAPGAAAGFLSSMARETQQFLGPTELIQRARRGEELSDRQRFASRAESIELAQAQDAALMAQEGIHPSIRGPIQGIRGFGRTAMDITGINSPLDVLRRGSPIFNAGFHIGQTISVIVDDGLPKQGGAN
jgi:hypothetical protein